jgi:hypothetical protein
MTTKEYQQFIIPPIQNLIPELAIRSEWKAFNEIQEARYSPRIDIAIGPFNVGPGPNIQDKYDNILKSNEVVSFLEQVYKFHKNNIEKYSSLLSVPEFQEILSLNHNSRCLIAIEIENRNSRKHTLGSIINACSLGRIGIGIAFTEATSRIFSRILNYLNFLRMVDKNSYNTNNFLLLTRTQLNDICNRKLNKKNL